MSVDKAFSRWACSLSGCDGGDPDSEIWVCGIEWGLGPGLDEENYYAKDLKEQIAKGPCQPVSTFDWKDSFKYSYGRNTAKLYAAIRYQSLQDYQDRILGDQTARLFKLNLYPIAFNNTDDALWEKHNLRALTGLQYKALYRAWCLVHRFPAIAKEVQNHHPKLIIGTGAGYLAEFVSCFAGHQGLAKEVHSGKIASNSPNDTDRPYFWTRLNAATTLAVIPFPSGRYGLNSDALIAEMGERLRKIIS